MSDKLSLSESTRPAWREIEASLLAVAELAKADVDAQHFYAALLHRAVKCTTATGAVLWLADAEGRLCPRHQVGIDPSHDQLWMRLQQTVADAIGNSQGGVTDVAFGNVHSAIFSASETPGVLQLLRQADPSDVPQDQQTILEAFAELASEYSQRRELLQLRRLREESAVWDDFSRSVHASLELDRVAYTMANDGRVLLDCDRLSVIECRGRKCRTLAVSGVDRLNRRSDLCRSLEQLASYVSVSGDEIWHDGDGSNFAPQVEACLQRYLDQAHSKRLAMVPLVPSIAADDEEPTTVGVVVAESFKEVRGDAATLREQIVQLARHGTPALRNAMTHQRMPLMPLSMAIRHLEQFVRLRALWILAAVLATAMILTALCLIPTELEIEAIGELQPLHRRDVFAATDGLIDQLFVEHGQIVQQGELMGTMKRSELELAASQVSGQILTTQRAIQSVRARRLSLVNSGSESTEQTTLAAEEEQLRLQLEGLEAQAEILHLQQLELEIRSPIDGQVITWDPAQLLRDRPVQRGQLLLTVAEPNGPWIVDLRVSDKDIGHVLAAQQNPTTLRVSFRLATNPSVTHSGHLQKVALTTERNTDGEATVWLTVAPDDTIAEGLRPGAGVIANVHCGKASLGYAWLHEFLDTLRTTWLF